jgi:hypothetical protein
MLSLTRTVQGLTLKLKLFEKGRREFQCGKYCSSFEVEALLVVQCRVHPRRSPPGGYSARVKGLDTQARALES